MVADSAQPSFRLPIAAPTQGCLLTTRSQCHDQPANRNEGCLLLYFCS
eukprot:CAMPEP_0201146672 /NCGR_PEP_ID=MMETSP0851-20130426/8332_1 /ASSEMBLY_ACC=CAM_ASM_000631 /TAXON_ID=183588 /ORGANISM="Pseudo-nitzschia fraudulenta, Strain WWA7" /LENGTH=47 /DNA_ID= /DNA_START= /DNA_END= /DNA_ORIENTATION=